jgi:CRISPR-associated protein Cmr4
LEEYTFKHKSGEEGLRDAAGHFEKLLPDDPVLSTIRDRLVILSDGMMSFFAQNACEVAQHVRISDETGTAEGGALFNQENVPSETLFYSVAHFFSGRGKKFKDKTPDDAVTEFGSKLAGEVFQFGGDASTGLGYCTVKLC